MTESMLLVKLLKGRRKQIINIDVCRERSFMYVEFEVPCLELRCKIN